MNGFMANCFYGKLTHVFCHGTSNTKNREIRQTPKQNRKTQKRRKAEKRKQTSREPKKQQKAEK
jgi:hypothetical protein